MITPCVTLWSSSALLLQKCTKHVLENDHVVFKSRLCKRNRGLMVFALAKAVNTFFSCLYLWLRTFRKCQSYQRSLVRRTISTRAVYCIRQLLAWRSLAVGVVANCWTTSRGMLSLKHAINYSLMLDMTITPIALLGNTLFQANRIFFLFYLFSKNLMFERP